jgi:hypothetical protein
MQDHAVPAIATDVRDGHYSQQDLMGGMELMAGGDLLSELTAIVCKEDEVPQQVQKTVGFKSAEYQKALGGHPPAL